MGIKVNKIIKKILAILILLQITIMPVANASELGDIFKSGDEFLNTGKEASQNTAEPDEKATINYDELQKTSNRVGVIMMTLGTALAVIIGVILGIQIMWGSIEQQVKAKEMLLPYGLGCIVVFGAFGIWQLAVTIFSQLS